RAAAEPKHPVFWIGFGESVTDPIGFTGKSVESDGNFVPALGDLGDIDNRSAVNQKGGGTTVLIAPDGHFQLAFGLAQFAEVKRDFADRSGSDRLAGCCGVNASGVMARLIDDAFGLPRESNLLATQHRGRQTRVGNRFLENFAV